MENLLRVAVLYYNPKRFSISMISLVPGERGMSFKVQLDSDECSSHWLNVSFQLKTWEFMNLIENYFTHFREANYFTDLLRIHVVKVMPLELRFLFDLAGDFLNVRHLCELAQRSHRAPEPFVDHFA